MTDASLRSLERAASQGDRAAEDRLARERMRATGRDPRLDPRADDVVDAPGPGTRMRSGRGGYCRAKGRVVLAIWPQELVTEVNTAWLDDGTHDDERATFALQAGTRVGRGIYYDSYRDETSLSRVRLPSDGQRDRDWVSVRVRGRVEVVLPDDRLHSYEVEWAPVLYPEAVDASALQEALATLESAGLPADEAAAMRKRLAPRVDGGLASATVTRGEAKTTHIAAWRDWAKRGTVRRVAP